MQKFKLVTCILFAKYYIEVGNVFFGPPGIHTFGQPFVDMLGVFRCTEHFYARIIAQDPIPDSHKNGLSAAPVSNRKTVQCGIDVISRFHSV